MGKTLPSLQDGFVPNRIFNTKPFEKPGIQPSSVLNSHRSTQLVQTKKFCSLHYFFSLQDKFNHLSKELIKKYLNRGCQSSIKNYLTLWN